MSETEKTKPTPAATAPHEKPISFESWDEWFFFTRHVYDTHQAVIRQQDLKAGVMIGILALLLTATLNLTKDIPLKFHMFGKGAATSWGFALSILVFLYGFFWTAWRVQDTLLPRHGNPNKVLGYMYALEILNHHSAHAYHESLTSISPEELLRELTRNIYTLSGIAKEKMEALRRAHLPIFLSLGAWAISTILIFYISSWK